MTPNPFLGMKYPNWPKTFDATLCALGAYGLEHEKPAGSRNAEYLPMKPQGFRNRELVVHIRRNGLKPGVVRIETSSFGHPVIQPKFQGGSFYGQV